jgi:alpha-methylacyl-CoA racemase
VRVVELAGIGPAPFGCMLLTDLGADVLRVERPGVTGLAGSRAGQDVRMDPLSRGRRVVTADLKADEGRDLVRRLAGAADVVVEPFRPGVAERLGVGPDDLTAINPRLVYARMTGWGQDGPLAARAGHDINYAAIAGALGAVGEPGRKPVPPLNLVADFGGGGMFLVTGVLAALVERAGSGLGQVVDVAMVDGTAVLLAMAFGQLSAGTMRPERGVNVLDGGAPFYDTYRCSDGNWLSVGALEPQFFAELLRVLGVAGDVPEQWDQAGWPRMRETFAAVIGSKPRADWVAAFDGVDACVAPVLGLDEVAGDPHVMARGSVVEIDGLLQPSVAPRLSRTPGAVGSPPGSVTVTAEQACREWGC